MSRSAFQNLVRAVVASTALTAVAACTLQQTPPTPAPPPAPEKPIPQLVIDTPKDSSAYLRNYYARIQATRLVHDQLRGDGGGPDTPFTEAMLARNFERIAFNSEYSKVEERRITKEHPVKLTRWSKPVRFALSFGDGVSEEQRGVDRQVFTPYIARLSRLTNHPISAVSETVPLGVNFTVFILTEDDRRAIAPALRRTMPDISDADLHDVINMRRDTQCAVFARDRGNDNRIDRAVAVIRAELPTLMRAACLHEELAQGLGLPNDSPSARPSIFNDSDEFGLLTNHDELLLQMLYDPRLQPGMGADEARPIFTKIAAELMSGSV
ncbi:Protein of unknown function [Aliiroseovarius halocynthiae]|uniref:DUF2927 domain-containing protein n=1 Tax=Aliiroseovarius halocynthiae TaxID=985055 RepID=A0A545SRE6_9RHOB|nr:DUF2927 domain-containing protein [Aliiroseovarius halocynthiae]TQV67529.1 DUF2927 domain-containing protein [Aliiroseovarius halocynthiae]SMR81541.1 Protein of unknown function [Aliiroseovarius halocynthiae]